MPSAINLTGPLGPEQFRNKLINGDFTFWQRGTSDTQGPASGAEVNSFSSYMSDRWYLVSSRGVGHTSSPASVPRVRIDRHGFTMGQPSLSDVSGSQYFTRVTIGAADGTGVSGVAGACMDMGNAYLQFGQLIEANDFGEWSGKTVWLSFLAKSYGDITHPTIGCRIGLRPDHNETITGHVWPDTTTGTYTELSGTQVGNRRYSNIVGDNINLTPEWQKFKRKFVLPEFTSGVTGGTDGVNSVGSFFTLACGTTGPAHGWAKSQVTDYLGLTSGFTGAFDVAQVQLEIGNDVSPFEKRHPQVELSMCQRYYEKTYDIETAIGTNTSYAGGLRSATDPTINPTCHQTTTFMTPKRATPTVVLYSKDGTEGKVFVTHGFNFNGTSRQANAGGVSNSGFATVQMYDDPNGANNLGYYTHGDTLITYHYTADAEL